MVRLLEQMLDETRLVAKEAEGVNPLVNYMVLGFQAWAERRLGMPERARATMAAADAVAAQFGTWLIFADWFAAARAEIELSAGEIEQALRLAKEAVDEAQSTDGVFSEGIAQRVWGQALAAVSWTDYREVDTHFQKSLKLFEKGDAVIETARTRIAWGKVLQARGDFISAQGHFEQAAAQFEAAGLVPESEETHRLLRNARNRD